MIFDAKHEMIRKLVRQFAETELTTEVLDRVEETGEFPEEIVEKMAKCGFLGLKIPREYGGAGLGLSLVWEIAGLHGGSVRVEESSERGTVFAVELPAQ